MAGTALITGASSGIGKALAVEFAKHNHNLVLVARSKEKLEILKKELEKSYSITVTTITADLTTHSAPDAVYHEVEEQGIFIEYLVNNAGFGHFGEFADTEWHIEEEMIELNITALTHLTKHFLTDMQIKKGGKIMNVASTAAFQPGPLMSVYYATKAYVLSFSEAIAEELAHKGITVTALCPGPTESNFQKVANLEGSGLFKGRKIPTSEEVAAFGFEAMMQGKRVAIHGKQNWLMAAGTRLAPRKIVTSIVKKISEKR